MISLYSLYKELIVRSFFTSCLTVRWIALFFVMCGEPSDACLLPLGDAFHDRGRGA